MGRDRDTAPPPAPARRRSRRAMVGDRVHGDVEGPRRGAWDAVYRLVRRIPRGRVMTYGQVAVELESSLSARAVGWALHGCPDDVPWHRVVNAAGACSTDRLPDVPAGLQRSMLEAEGVEFDDGGTLDLTRYRHVPRRRPPRDDPRPPRRSGARVRRT